MEGLFLPNVVVVVKYGAGPSAEVVVVVVVPGKWGLIVARESFFVPPSRCACCASPLLGKLGFNWDTGLRGASTGWSSDSHAPVTSLSVLTAGNAKRLGRPAALLPVVVLVAAGVAAVDWFPFDSSLLLE